MKLGLPGSAPAASNSRCNGSMWPAPWTGMLVPAWRAPARLTREGVSVCKDSLNLCVVEPSGTSTRFSGSISAHRLYNAFPGPEWPNIPPHRGSSEPGRKVSFFLSNRGKVKHYKPGKDHKGGCAIKKRKEPEGLHQGGITRSRPCRLTKHGLKMGSLGEGCI